MSPATKHPHRCFVDTVVVVLEFLVRRHGVDEEAFAEVVLLDGRDRFRIAQRVVVVAATIHDLVVSIHSRDLPVQR